MNEQPIDELAKALAAAQGTFENPAKDAKANIHGKDGRQGYAYAYATLDALQNATRKALAANGLAITQLVQPSAVEGWELHTVLLHSSGQSITSRFPLLQFGQGAQTVGSEITYMRRYSYASILNITADEDEDGHEAQSSKAHAAGTEYKLNPNPPSNALDSHQIGRITGVTTSADGQCWFIDLGEFSKKGSGNNVWTRDREVGEALAQDQGKVVDALLRSTKKGSYRLVSYSEAPPVEASEPSEPAPRKPLSVSASSWEVDAQSDDLPMDDAPAQPTQSDTPAAAGDPTGPPVANRSWEYHEIKGLKNSPQFLGRAVGDLSINELEAIDKNWMAKVRNVWKQGKDVNDLQRADYEAFESALAFHRGSVVDKPF